jgi:hypothetical protein
LAVAVLAYCGRANGYESAQLLLKLVNGRIHGFVYRAGSVSAHAPGKSRGTHISCGDRPRGRGTTAQRPLDPREQFINRPTLVATHSDWEVRHVLAPVGYWRAAILIQDAG